MKCVDIIGANATVPGETPWPNSKRSGAKKERSPAVGAADIPLCLSNMAAARMHTHAVSPSQRVLHFFLVQFAASNYTLGEDMDLIEVLWKQDVDLGFTLVEPTATTKKASTSEKETEDDIEKLKTLEAINANNEKKDSKDFTTNEDDPWAGLPYTVDLETGKY
ncbi:hypothetical protein WN55_04827 [Dufourea novaeangliae]|uniref:Uncharacterized protein n=1 Tax=Dufourea novaeangliae TaxID=178035 RepID=A0A154NZG3_DUFNO|nr:hypothetical protein WN55_04827 [Dufourea novaeangliae]